jgi:hypothetical protein
MPVNMGRQATPTFLNTLNSQADSQQLQKMSFCLICITALVRLCTLNCTLEFVKHVEHV